MRKLIFILWVVPLFADIEINTSIRNVNYRGSSELAGFLRITVNDDDFQTASTQEPIFMRISLASDAFLAKTLVDQSLPNDDHRKRPIYLAMSLNSLHENRTLTAPTDTFSIVRWVRGERFIWIRCQRDSDDWVSDGSLLFGPDEDHQISFTFGISARTSSDEIMQLDEGHANLPFNTRDLETSSNSYWNATSTLFSVDLSNSSLQDREQLILDNLVLDYLADKGGGIYEWEGANQFGSAFPDDPSVARGTQPLDKFSMSGHEDQPRQRPDSGAGLDSVSNRFSFLFTSEQEDLTLYDGTKVVLSAPAGTGFGEKDLRFIFDFLTCDDGHGIVVPLSSAFTYEEQTYYAEVEIVWEGGAQSLTSFALDLEATLFFPHGSVGEKFIGWEFQLVNNPAAEDERPFSGADQHISSEPEPFTIDSGVWLIADLSYPRMIPHVTLNEGNFRTDIRLVNAGKSSHDIQLTAYDRAGTFLESVGRRVDVGSSEKVSIAELFSAGGVSHFRIEGDPQIQISAVYRANREGAGPVHVRATDQEEKRWLLYAGDASLTYDGLAIVNPSEKATAIRIKQFDGQGQLVEERVLSEVLEPNAKVTVVLGKLFNAVENGSFEVEADELLSVLALRGDFDSNYVWENRAVEGNSF